MMEKYEDGHSTQETDALFDHVLAVIRSKGRGEGLLASKSVMSALDVHHKIYYLLGSVLKVSTHDVEKEGSQSLLN